MSRRHYVLMSGGSLRRALDGKHPKRSQPRVNNPLDRLKKLKQKQTITKKQFARDERRAAKSRLEACSRTRGGIENVFRGGGTFWHCDSFVKGRVHKLLGDLGKLYLCDNDWIIDLIGVLLTRCAVNSASQELGCDKTIDRSSGIDALELMRTFVEEVRAIGDLTLGDADYKLPESHARWITLYALTREILLRITRDNSCGDALVLAAHLHGSGPLYDRALERIKNDAILALRIAGNKWATTDATYEIIDLMLTHLGKNYETDNMYIVDLIGFLFDRLVRYEITVVRTNNLCGKSLPDATSPVLEALRELVEGIFRYDQSDPGGVFPNTKVTRDNWKRLAESTRNVYLMLADDSLDDDELDFIHGWEAS